MDKEVEAAVETDMRPMQILYNEGDKPTDLNLGYGQLQYNQADDKLYTVGDQADVIEIHEGVDAKVTQNETDIVDIDARVTQNETDITTIETALNTDGVWIDIPTINGWVPYDAAQYPSPQYKIMNGIVYIQGLIKDGWDDQIGTLPAEARPPMPLLVLVPVEHGQISVRMEIEPDGTIGYPWGDWSDEWTSMHCSYVL